MSKESETPTWEGEIKGFFTQLDIGCMRRLEGSAGFSLDSYEDVKCRAKSIHEYVKIGYMPLDGRRWSPGKVHRFLQWIEAGCPQGAGPGKVP